MKLNKGTNKKKTASAAEITKAAAKKPTSLIQVMKASFRPPCPLAAKAMKPKSAPYRMLPQSQAGSRAQ